MLFKLELEGVGTFNPIECKKLSAPKWTRTAATDEKEDEGDLWLLLGLVVEPEAIVKFVD